MLKKVNIGNPKQQKIKDFNPNCKDKDIKTISIDKNIHNCLYEFVFPEKVLKTIKLYFYWGDGRVLGPYLTLLRGYS